MATTVGTGADTLAAVRSFTAWMTAHATTPVSDPAAAGDDRLAVIAAMEQLRSTLAAAQAVEVAAFAAERRAAVEADIATVERPGIGVQRRREAARRQMVAGVALARRVSPAKASRYVAFAEHAPTDLPATFALLARGELSERGAELVFTAVTPLTPPLRRTVDKDLAPRLPGLGDVRVDQAARAAVYAVDPAGVVKRNAYAASQRRVSVRPAPDCMAFVTLLTTMPFGVAIRAQLEADVRAAVAAGDTRGRGAIMADTMVARVLNPAPAPAAQTTTGSTGGSAGTTDGCGTDGPTAGSRTGRPVPPEGAPFTGPVSIQLLITDRTLTGGNDAAHFANGEPYPAPLARDLALATHPDGAVDPAAARSVRRLFTDSTGRLVTAETTSRRFTPAMRDLITLRDSTCTTPWCNAPIADIDHHHPATAGGPTSLTNGHGLCRWCNVTKADRPPNDPPTPPTPPTDTAPAATPPPPPCTPASPVERRLRRHLRRQARIARRRHDREHPRPEPRPTRC